MGPAIRAIAHDVEVTPRQRLLLRLIATGYATKEIAGRLSISTRTAQWHISRLLAMFDAPNRAALVHAAETRGLLDEIEADR